MGATFSTSMNASAGGGFGAASSDGAFDMMEVDVLGLGTQGEGQGRAVRAPRGQLVRSPLSTRVTLGAPKGYTRGS